MPTFPAAKLLNFVVGVDVHKVIGVPVHPFFGPLILWHTPLFPKADVFVNGLPACAVGATAYGPHIPQGAPIPDTPTNVSYWQRWKTNVIMAFVLMGLMLLANMAIAAISSLIPKPKWAEDFLKDVTGIDTTKEGAYWNAIKGSVGSLTQFWTWVKLLMPPLPWPIGNGSTAVGSPSVQVNGAPMAFCLAPLCATSCTDIPFSIVPNAMVVGFSNVMVGISLADLARGVAVQSAKAAVSAAVVTGVQKYQNRGQQGC